ncbi:MAG: LCP family protein [Acidimicrobiales bacterium]
MPVPPHDVESRRAPTRRPPAARSGSADRRPPQRPNPRATPRPAGSNRPRSRRHMVRRWLAVGMGILALLFGGVAAWGVIQFNRIDRVGVDLTKAADLAPQNFLVVGSDTRELGDGPNGADGGAIYGSKSERAPGGKRADTIVIARVDPGKATIEILSVPRDLWVNTHGGERINSAYNSGAQALVDTIESNLGIPINHYVEVNFNGFKGLVEAVGGVQLYFDRPVRDSNTGLNIRKKGCYNLNGVQALAFARSRHLLYSDGVKWINDQTGDLGRITRQQTFLRHALAKVSGMGLDDLDSLRVLTGVAVNNVKIDDSLGTNDIIRLARKFSGFDAKKMVVHRLSTTPFRTSRGADVLQVSKELSKPVLDIFSGKAASTQVATVPTTALTPKAVTVDVLNGAGVAGLARTAANRLGSLGFAIGTVDNSARVKATVVSYATGSEAQAKLVASKISPVPAVKLDPSLAAGKVVVKLASELNVPGSSDVAIAVNTPASAGGAAAVATTVPASGAGTATPEKTLGLNLGDPPPGIVCG